MSDANAGPESYISVSEAAELLDVTTTTVRRYVQSGKITPFRRLPSGVIRVPLSEVKRILEPIDLSDRSLHAGERRV